MEVSVHCMTFVMTQNSARMVSHNCRHYKPIITSKIHRIKPVSCRVSMQSGSKTANFYQLLSLSSQNAGFDEIKKAFKNMALQYHPDVVCSDLTKAESTEKFIESRRAYETLSDPDLRRVYDYGLLTGLEDPFESYVGSSKRKGIIRCKFSREVWERQLEGLKKRSAERSMKKRRYGPDDDDDDHYLLNINPTCVREIKLN